WPSASRRFTATDFLLRACAYHQSELPSWSLRHFLSGSPSPGDSTLITSAPNSASRRAQYGPAISVPSSTTFSFDSGPSTVGTVPRARRLPRPRHDFIDIVTCEPFHRPPCEFVASSSPSRSSSPPPGTHSPR